MPPTDSLDLVGSMVAGKYLVERVVGEGGFAVVYRAQHVVWQRPVALKVYKTLAGVSAEDREAFVSAFVREGALLADLSERCSAICQARDVGMLESAHGEEIPYTVLEWLEGASLVDVLSDEVLRRVPPRTIDEAIRLLEPVAIGLALAHKCGIAHRDVKPGNVFVIGDPRADAPATKLLDFGIAKVVSETNATSAAFAKTSGQISAFTPQYGAPEQFSRKYGATGPWTDVFALALILVEVLSGRDPFDAEDVVQLAVLASDNERRPTPRTLGVAVSDDVETVFARALAVRPEDRFPTAGHLWNALRAALGLAPLAGIGGPSSARRAPAPTSSQRRGAASAGAVIDVPTSERRDGSAGAVEADRSRARTLARRRAATIGTLLALVAAATVVTVVQRTVHSAHGDGAASARTSAPSTQVATSASALASAAPSSATTCPSGMVAVPGGQFFMGADDGTPMEQPAHAVKVRAFCIDRYETTVAAYKTCSDSGRCKRASTTNEWASIAPHDHEAFDPLCNARDPLGRAQHPINCVDWEMADRFCKQEGKRLPTESEWELAARGPDGRRYPWGDDAPTAGLLNACGAECVAWGKHAAINLLPMYAADDGWPNTAPVGTFPNGASRYGVEDVVGNVWEWVADWFAAYAKDEQENPQGPDKGSEKVIRGGAWNGADPSWVRPTFRYKDVPSKRSYGIGFRCAT